LTLETLLCGIKTLAVLVYCRLTLELLVYAITTFEVRLCGLAMSKSLLFAILTLEVLV